VDADGLYRTSCNPFYVPDDHSLRQAILSDAHDAPHAGHTGFTKTYDKVARLFWWPHLRSDVHSYVTHCDICQRSKTISRKPDGHLQPLPVPDRMFQIIAMDLIVKLPSTHSQPAFDSTIVIVDRLTKFVRLIPCREAITAGDVVHCYTLTGFLFLACQTRLCQTVDPTSTILFPKRYSLVSVSNTLCPQHTTPKLTVRRNAQTVLLK
jgi:hypothetical protein